MWVRVRTQSSVDGEVCDLAKKRVRALVHFESLAKR